MSPYSSKDTCNRSIYGLVSDTKVLEPVKQLEIYMILRKIVFKLK